MKLLDKMFPLSPQTNKILTKQLNKEGITPKPKWQKQFIGFITHTDDGDTFFTLYNKNDKEFYCSCAIFNERDTYDPYIGEVIAINRMALNSNFQAAITDSRFSAFTFIDAKSFHYSPSLI